MKQFPVELLSQLMGALYGMQYQHDHRQCPRGMVTAGLFEPDSLLLIAAGRNLVPARHAPCKCDDDADTHCQGSQTCKATHAEVRAINKAQQEGNLDKARILLSTRPPCEKCFHRIEETPVELIVTTDQYPDRDRVRMFWEAQDKQWMVLPHAKYLHLRHT